MAHRFLAERVSPARVERLLVDWANLPDKGEPRFPTAVGRLTKLYPEIFGRSVSVGHDIRLMIWSISIHLRRAWDASDPRHREWYIFAVRQTYGQFVERVLLPPFSPSQDNRVDSGFKIDEQKKREIHARFAGICSWLPGTHLGSYASSTPVHPVTDFDIAGSEDSKMSDVGAHRELRFLRAWTTTWSKPPKGPPPRTPFEDAAVRFHRIAVCARHCSNPECPAPYFFAERKGQKYCSVKCAADGQREAKRRWWHENKDRVRRNSK